MKHLFELSVGMLLSLILVFSSAGNYLRAQNHFDGSKSVENNSTNKVDGFLGPDQTICFGEEVRLEAPLAFSYVWSTGQTTQFIIVNPVVTKDYWV
ncbi:MAG: hypothetical protein Q8T08_06660, partial [Ignavibacteria bacterium]|nr:hypothetical protein [Ignavibacteria bacterium]